MLGQHALLAAQGKIGPVVARIAAPGAPERTKRLVIALAVRAAIDFFDRVNFIIQRTNVIDHQMVFMLAFIQLLTRRDLWEKVDDRGTVQRQMAGIDHALQLFIRLIQQNEDVEGFFAFTAFDKRAQTAQADEAEAGRKGEILLQQAVAVKVAQIVGKQSLVRLKALLAQRVRGQQLSLRLRADRLADDPGVVLHHQLQQLQRFNIRTAEEKFQAVEIQVSEVLRAVAGDADP